MKRKGDLFLFAIRYFLILSTFFPLLTAQEALKTEKKKREPLSEASKMWLEEVVPYIINDVEKEIFINLPTEIDRGKFIENFWRRRDPDPTTEENEFKLEYYRRIALANKFFGTAGAEGWRTDRGKIFILLGPPNEIQRDLNPQGSTLSAFHGPKEIWNYWSLPNPKLPPNLEFVFVDKLGTSHYVLEKSLGIEPGGGSTLDIDELSYQFDYMENIAEAMKNPFEKLDKLKGIITTQVTYDHIPFEYDLFYLKGPEKRALVPLVIEIPYAAIPQKIIEDQYCYSLTLVVNASNPLGQIVFEKNKDINFKHTSSEMDSLKDKKLCVQTTLYLEPEVTGIHLLILDNFSGKIGTSHKKISIPDFSFDEIVLSDIIVFNSSSRTEDWTPDKREGRGVRDKIFTDIGDVFREGQELNVYFEVYNLSLDPKTELNNFKIEYLILLNGKLLARVPSPKEEQTNEKDCIIQTSFKLKNFKPGQYSLRTKVTDENTGKTALKEVQFQVIQ